MDDKVNRPTLIAWKLRDVNHLHMNCLHNIISSHGLHIGQPRILHTIKKLDGATQKEIADYLNISPASLATSIKRMEKSGLLRKITDKTDLRRNSVQLTAHGEKVIKDSFNQLADMDSKMLGGFSEEELDKLSHFLDRLNNNLVKLQPCYSDILENNTTIVDKDRED